MLGALCRTISIQGATPLHLAALRLDACSAEGAIDTVRALTPSTAAAAALDARAAAVCTPIGTSCATPLEAACASSQLAETAIRALVSHGSRLDGSTGARAVMLCLSAGRRKKARQLLQRKVCDRMSSACLREDACHDHGREHCVLQKESWHEDVCHAHDHEHEHCVRRGRL